MSYRFTATEKWRDKWFRNLPPPAKLAFIYICENCDAAGFYQYDVADIAFHTGMEERAIEGAFKLLERSFLRKGDWIWIKRFLEHQKNLPVNPNNPAHKPIVVALQKRVSEFPEIPNLIGAEKGLLSPLRSPIGKGKVKVRSGNGEGKVQRRKGGRVKENTPLMIEIGSWFNRSPTTLWSVSEAEALKALGEIDEAEFKVIGDYYKLDIPSNQDFRRKNVETLLNKWNGEIDRARKFKRKQDLRNLRTTL